MFSVVQGVWETKYKRLAFPWLRYVVYVISWLKQSLHLKYFEWWYTFRFDEFGNTELIINLSVSNIWIKKIIQSMLWAYLPGKVDGCIGTVCSFRCWCHRCRWFVATVSRGGRPDSPDGGLQIYKWDRKQFVPDEVPVEMRPQCSLYMRPYRFFYAIAISQAAVQTLRVPIWLWYWASSAPPGRSGRPALAPQSFQPWWRWKAGTRKSDPEILSDRCFPVPGWNRPTLSD